MDRQARKLQTQREDQGTYGDEAAHEPSDEEEKEVSGSVIDAYENDLNWMGFFQ